MMIYSVFILAAGIYLFLSALFNILYLHLVSRQNKTYSYPADFSACAGADPENPPKVSVLIPARNEAARIRPLLESLLRQNYPNYEICVLNDGSSDGTDAVLAEFQQQEKRLRVFEGRELPPGWKGKPYALQQLIEQTDGEWVICLDADLKVSSDFITWTLCRMKALHADCLSAWPRHFFNSWADYLFCPAMYTMTAFLLPLWLIPLVKNKFFSFAIQFAVYKREPLLRVGGYGAVKNVMNEDLGMARAMKAAGYRSVFIDAKKKIRGTMYENFESAVVGIERSIADVFDGKCYPVVALTLFFLLSMVVPFFYGVISTVLQSPGWQFGLIGILFSWLAWVFTMADRRLNVLSWIMAPVVFLSVIILGWRSYFRFKSGKGYIWKGRKVV